MVYSYTKVLFRRPIVSLKFNTFVTTILSEKEGYLMDVFFFKLYKYLSDNSRKLCLKY